VNTNHDKSAEFEHRLSAEATAATPRGSYALTTALHLPRSAPILDIRVESRTVKTFVLEDAIDVQPGQFIMAWLPGLDEKPLSIAWDNPLTVTVAAVGPFSQALHTKQVGERVGWRGPYGRPYRLDPDRPALLVGGGYGAAPLYFLTQRARAEGISVTVALGARKADDLIFVRRFQELGIPLIFATDDGSTGFHGYVTEAIRQDGVLQDQRPAIYACGPEGMLVALHHICTEFGLPGQLSVERYMKCGFGLCGQCALDDLLTCIDGPVLTVEQLTGKADFGHYHRTTTGRRLPLGH
jgi:dihydroorotate dehydrogenase electron transfer subunit